jgi:SRSO17 transposase
MFEAREPASTIKFVDDYCQWYRKLFPEVRSFEAFKYLHVGMISDIKRKTRSSDITHSWIEQRA